MSMLELCTPNGYKFYMQVLFDIYCIFKIVLRLYCKSALIYSNLYNNIEVILKVFCNIEIWFVRVYKS